jgi:hypothetical protein
LKGTEEMRIFCISWPKAGTHLLLELAKSILPEGPWVEDKDIKYTSEGDELFFQKVSERISKYGDNFAIKGHIPWSESIESFLLSNDFQILFIVRDPRDVICSTYRWLTDLRKNWECSKFLAEFSPKIQLEYIIKGMPLLYPFDNDAGVIWDAPLPVRYSKLTPWFYSAGAIAFTYEKLSGNLGQDTQKKEVVRALSFLKIDPKETTCRVLQSLYNPNSATFHSGKVGNWVDYFSDHHKKLFVELAGEELIEMLGYEATQPK